MTTKSTALPVPPAPNQYPKEEFEQAIVDSESLIVNAIKFFSMKVPPLVPYFSLIQMRALNKPNLTMRLNLKSTGGNAILEYNPKWVLRLNQQCVLAFLFYGETLRIALHHCTTRLHQPATINLLSSNLIVYEVQELLQKWVKEVQECSFAIPTYQDVAPLIEPLGFIKAEHWTHDFLFQFLYKAAIKNSNQSNEGLQKKLDQLIQQKHQLSWKNSWLRTSLNRIRSSNKARDSRANKDNSIANSKANRANRASKVSKDSLVNKARDSPASLVSRVPAVSRVSQVSKARMASRVKETRMANRTDSSKVRTARVATSLSRVRTASNRVRDRTATTVRMASSKVRTAAMVPTRLPRLCRMQSTRCSRKSMTSCTRCPRTTVEAISATAASTKMLPTVPRHSTTTSTSLPKTLA